MGWLRRLPARGEVRSVRPGGEPPWLTETRRLQAADWLSMYDAEARGAVGPPFFTPGAPVCIAFGRIVASEIEVPIMLGDLV